MDRDSKKALYDHLPPRRVFTSSRCYTCPRNCPSRFQTNRLSLRSGYSRYPCSRDTCHCLCSRDNSIWPFFTPFFCKKARLLKLGRTLPFNITTRPYPITFSLNRINDRSFRAISVKLQQEIALL